jgi:hypothetical protein
MKNFQPRDEVVGFARRTLMGPANGDDEAIDGTPFLRYMTGILFPQGAKLGGALDEVSATADEGTPAVEELEEAADEIGSGVDLASEALPSAVGLSFKVPDDALVTCSVWGAHYEKDEAGKKGGGRGKTVWKRNTLGNRLNPETVTIRKGAGHQDVFGGRAKVTTRWRSGRGRWAIVTVALVNTQRMTGRGPDPGKALFQVGLRCEVDGGIYAYPQVGAQHEPESEESEVEYLYRSILSFARGHGAAANWGEAEDNKVPWAEVDFMPTVDVPRPTFEVTDPGVDARCCDLDFLVSKPKEEVLGALGSLADAYIAWGKRQRAGVAATADPIVADKLVERIEDWGRRMRKGVELLRKDEQYEWRCFNWANLAMGMQMVLSKARPKVPYSRHENRSRPALGLAGLQWRPFQIAFMLGLIESLVNPKSGDREVVDVIWFPTGGGKTEAYLLASAFELIRRRLHCGDDDTATAIISRYTLRFLTAQQFQRTGALVVALEMLRKEHGDVLGNRPFTLGLWVGNTVTPGDLRTAHQWHQEQLDSQSPRNRFLVQSCPCCGTEIYPTKKHKGRAWSDADFGVVSTQGKFFFRCPSKACDFHQKLPLEVVDDNLYERPTSILLATVDKFALLPWDDRARSFFFGPEGKSPPPSLILQDELHLISGPLGSLAAPYDAAIDAIIRAKGVRPKRIGSTATIRNARDQIRGLYGLDVTVFPSPSTRWDDAFFFSTDASKAGRTYLGIMGQGYIKPVVAMAWTAAALLQSVKEVSLPPEALDSYWTLLAYHNSRRELGRTMTAAQDEIQARVRAIAKSEALARELGEPLELSAQMVKSLGEAIEALEKPYMAGEPPVDLVPCTSIISVGVDLVRLGIMLMNGQPKLTSEYIQATSRVGRGNVPGLVVSLFSATKPRDRSHYEDFRAYHESIYRHVEPTSLTPYALPARERTLHAAIVAVVRHATRFNGNTSARDVDFDDPDVRRLLGQLSATMAAADPSEVKGLQELMATRLKEWRDRSESGRSLVYERLKAGHAFEALLYQYGKSQAGSMWPTMMSVRNVDSEVGVRVVGEEK